MYIGIDIGGTKIAGALVNAKGGILERAQHPTEAHSGGDHVLGCAVAVAADLARRASGMLDGIGIGAPGQIDTGRGRVLNATALLPGWSGTDVAGRFAKEFGLPVAVDNDVNALASGEVRLGAARGFGTVVFLAIGTGLGGAILLNGRLHHGAHWTGGEFGSLLIDISPEARVGGSGERGTLEAYVSGPGLIETYREMTGDTRGHLTGRDVVADADADPNGAGGAAIRRTAEYLGFGLVSLANVLDPDIFIIGGGLAALGDRLIGPAAAILRDRALPGPARAAVVTASLGADASVLGAASLVMGE